MLRPTRRSDSPAVAHRSAVRPCAGGSIATAREPDKPAAPTPPMPGGHARPLAAVGTGSEVSRGCLFQNRNIQSLIGDQLLQPSIFCLQPFQTLRLIHSEPAILLPPAVVGR